jgi:hypothetical protein
MKHKFSEFYAALALAGAYQAQRTNVVFYVDFNSDARDAIESVFEAYGIEPTERHSKFLGVRVLRLEKTLDMDIPMPVTE